MSARLRTLVSDTAVYGVFTIIGRFLTFLLTPFYSNFLSQNAIDDIITIFAVLAFINVVYSMGMESAFFRFYEKENFNQNKKVFTHAFLSIFLISIATSALIFFTADITSPLILKSTDNVWLIKTAALIPLLDAMILIPYGLLRMQRKSLRFSTIKFLQIIIAVGFNLYFVMNLDMGAMGVMAAQFIASVFGLILFIPALFNYFVFSVDFKLLKEMLKFGLPTMPANLSAIILQVADRPILNALAPDKLATYGINYRLGIPMMLFVTVFEYAWKPFYLSNYKEKNAKELYSRVLTYFTAASAAIFILVSFYIEFIVRLPFIGGKFINPAYWSGMEIIPIILAGYYFNGLYTNFAAGFLIKKKTSYLPVAVIAAAVVNLVMNFTLVPAIGYTGAAWATLGAYMVSAGILYFYSRKIYPVIYEWKRIFILIGLTSLIFFTDKLLFSDLDLLLRFISKSVLIFIFLIFLKLLGFFTKDEINLIKKMLKRK
jgi:O-antigen/teichoic acid export membrane protein